MAVDKNMPILIVDDYKTMLRIVRNGLVTLLFRSLSSFRRPFVRKPRGFFHPAMNVADAGYRTR